MGDPQVRSDTRIIGSGVKALACSAALVAVTTLAGCGGSSQKPAVLGSTGAAGATSSAAAPSTSAATSSAAPTSSAPTTSASASAAGDYAAFPGFTPPADFKDIFEPTPSTGNPVKDKILADNVQALRAMDVWSFTGDFNTPGIASYLSPAMRAAFQAQTVQYHAAGKVPAGTVRFYNDKILAFDNATARVMVCEDGRQGFDKDSKTGQMIPGSSDGIVAIFTTVAKSPAGVWQAEMYSKEKASSQCAAP